MNYKFKDKKLFELAMTQSGANATHNNERLEFIGDRVLGLAVSVMLYEMFPNESEGELARRHSVLVSTNTNAIAAKQLGLDKKVKHGHMTAGRREHMFANTTEALLGAIYLDGGFEAAQKFINEIWQEYALADITAPKDAKTELQELAQKSGEMPKYEFLNETGKTHNPTFTARVSAMGKTAMGNGTSKKLATSNAAAALLAILEKSN